MNLSSVVIGNPVINRALMFRIPTTFQSLVMAPILNTNVLITPESDKYYNCNNNHTSVPGPSYKEISTPSKGERFYLPQIIKDISYKNPLTNTPIITSVGIPGHSYMDPVTHEEYLFNKLRNDTKHRKRAFAKRGYFRRTRALNRRSDRLSYAYALQGIDLEMLENLEMGEIPDLKDFMK